HARGRLEGPRRSVAGTRVSRHGFGNDASQAREVNDPGHLPGIAERPGCHENRVLQTQTIEGNGEINHKRVTTEYTEQTEKRPKRKMQRKRKNGIETTGGLSGSFFSLTLFFCSSSVLFPCIPCIPWLPFFMALPGRCSLPGRTRRSRAADAILPARSYRHGPPARRPCASGPSADPLSIAHRPAPRARCCP